MNVLGLTGSIGMGKTTAADMFRWQNIPVFDADRVVHKLLSKNGEAVEPIKEKFDGVFRNGEIDRSKLGSLVFFDNGALGVLEKILHPLVKEKQRKFLMSAANSRRPLVVLDIPLLYETGSDINCDSVAVVSAPHYLQKLRVMSRRGMTDDKFKAIISHQMCDDKKRSKADFIVPTGLGKRLSYLVIKEIIRTMRRE